MPTVATVVFVAMTVEFSGRTRARLFGKEAVEEKVARDSTKQESAKESMMGMVKSQASQGRGSKESMKVELAE
jgi:hypothetical protein